MQKNKIKNGDNNKTIKIFPFKIFKFTGKNLKFKTKTRILAKKNFFKLNSRI